MKNLVLSLNFNLRYNKEAEFYYRDLGAAKTQDLKLQKEGGKDGGQLCSPLAPMYTPEKSAAGSAPISRTLARAQLGDVF